MKKGQISLFVIITIILILVILIIFLFSSKNLLNFSSNKITPEIQPIYETLNNCIEQRAIDAIYLIGLQGGYISLPENYLKTNISNIAYGLYNKKNTLSSLEKIEKEIENYIEISVLYCINEDDFPDYEITQKQASSNVRVKDDKVIVKTRLPLSIKKGESTTELKHSYETEIPIRLGKIYKTANDIIEKQLSDLDYVPVSYLTNLEFNIVFIPFDEDILIYIITDDKSKINEIPYSFMFGVKLK